MQNSSVSVLRSCGSARHLAAQWRTIVRPSQIGTTAHASRGIRRGDGPRTAKSIPRCKPLLSFGVDGGGVPLPSDNLVSRRIMR
jgi:hypothetical protein